MQIKPIFENYTFHYGACDLSLNTDEEEIKALLETRHKNQIFINWFDANIYQINI